MNEDRHSRWEDAADVPLMVVAAVFLVAYAWPILNPSLGEPGVSGCTWVTWLAWASFAVDYLVRPRPA